MAYKESAHNGVVRLADGAYIPVDPANTDYQQYLVWLDAGGIPAPADLPAKVPLVVSRFQALAALMQAGLLENVEAYMAQEGTDAFVKLAWHEAQEFRQDSPTVVGLQTILGLTDEQLEDLFKFAATVSA